MLLVQLTNKKTHISCQFCFEKKIARNCYQFFFFAKYFV